MKKNTLEDYKNAIKEQYEIAKSGDSSSLLLNPSRARLRNLCFELFKDNPGKDDLMSFASFFGLEFSATNFNTLKDLTDKFRPIETFFKGETDLMDIEGVNIAAILVGFEPRPYLKFSKTAGWIEQPLIENSIESTPVVNEDLEEVGIAEKQPYKSVRNEKKKSPLFFNKPFIIAGVSVLLISCFGFFSLSKEKCMQWQKDHYELVDCENASMGIVNLYSKVPLDEKMLYFKKIEVSDTTTFFKYEKPIIWYCKKGNELEFFNNPGFNPENNKPLRPITQYMIDKYVSQKK